MGCIDDTFLPTHNRFGLKEVTEYLCFKIINHIRYSALFWQSNCMNNHLIAWDIIVGKKVVTHALKCMQIST